MAANSLPQAFGPHGVALDGDDIYTPVRQREGDRARAGADLHDQLPWPEVGLGDESLSELGTEDVLTETTPSLVPGRPPLGGHGGSPR
jgi:hypothetical protein